MTTSGGVTGTPALNGLNPATFGALGWTVDPAACASSAAPGLNQVYLTQFTAATTGPVGHLLYNVASAGVTLTANQCGIAIYDTGQALAGSASLLGQSASTDVAWASTGTLSTALLVPVPVVQGESYYVGFLVNGTTAPGFSRGGNMSALLTNAGQSSGAMIRYGMMAGAGKSAFPATTLQTNVSDAGFTFCVVATA